MNEKKHLKYVLMLEIHNLTACKSLAMVSGMSYTNLHILKLPSFLEMPREQTNQSQFQCRSTKRQSVLYLLLPLCGLVVFLLLGFLQ